MKKFKPNPPGLTIQKSPAILSALSIVEIKGDEYLDAAKYSA